MEWTQANEAIKLFQPHQGQEEFIKLIDGGFIVISGAGNSWGKSELIAAILAAAMWPSMAPDPLRIAAFQDWRFPKRARIYSGPAELEEIGSLQTAIDRLFPRGHYEVSKGRYSYPSVFHTDTGWILDLFSYERDAKEAAGPNIGLQAFNEPPPEALFKEAVPRSRSGGYIIGGFTSLLDNVWVVDGLLNKADGKNIRVRYGNSCENCKQHGVNGNLEHEQIEKSLSQCDPDEREARFSGRPLSMSGRIFKAFDPAVHVATEEFEPPKDQPISIGMVVDPAIGKPLAILWRYVDKTGTVNYYDEWPEFTFHGAKDSNLTVKDYAELIRARENGRTVDTRILDRHFGNTRRTLGGMTLRQEFMEQGLEFQDSYACEEEIETGILKVKEYLRYDKSKPIDSLNRPKVRISPKCVNLIASMKMWSRDPKTEKPKEDFKDFADLIRYDLMSNPEIETRQVWSGTKPYYGVQA